MIDGTDTVYKLAKKYHLKTAFGTDILFSAREAEQQDNRLASLIRWYTPVEALIMATSTNAELLALSGLRNPYPGKLGVIEEGAFADLLVVDGVRCNAVFERIDLAKWSATLIDHAMDPVTEKVRDVIRGKTDLSDKAAPLWAKLQEPISLGSGAWLEVRPYAAFANVPEVTDNGEYLTMKAGLEARPRVVLGARPTTGTHPLPPLSAHEYGPRFNVNLRAVLEYDKMTRLLRQKLVGQTFAAGESWPASRIRVTVADASVRRDGQRVEVSVRVTGFVRGTLHLVGTPIFRDRGRLHGDIIIRNLDYTIQTRSLLLRLGNRIFQRRILDRLRAAAEWDISSELAQTYNQVNQALNQQLTPEARLVTSLSTFRPGRIFVTAGGVEADHLVTGQVSVVVTPF